ncbi:hypothetical protein CASFOL_025583 [Castilleja foliolosa]|uniref:ARC105/Med15 mediator subunit C-terminal domain-containing protein n=1 Tax=Castilleja foliolosa TaxID=1961234 RepID=A0ABD3CU18_9LAMI
MPSSGLSIYNQQSKSIAAMTSNYNSNYNNNNNNNNNSLWQHQLSDNQRTETSLPYIAPERQNIYQFPMQSNPYPSNLRQYRQVQALPVCHPNQMSLMPNKGLERPSCSVSERELLHMSSFHQAQNVTLADQMKPVNQTQTTHLGFTPLQALPESTPQPQLTNSTEWMDHAYYKILQMKQMFFPDLLTLYKRSQELRQSVKNVETLNKCERIKTSMERVINFLNMSRSDISGWRKEKLFETMNGVVKYANQAKASNAQAQKQNQLIVEPNNGVRLQNIIQFNNSQQPNEPRPIIPAQLNNKTVFSQWEFKPQNAVQRNEQTNKKLRNNKQQVMQRQKKNGRLGGLINPRKLPPLSPAGGANSPHNSSSGIDLIALSSPSSSSRLSNSGTVSVSASACAFASPSTPCSMPADFTKSPLSIDENCKFPQNSADPTLQGQNLIVADELQGAIDSGLNTESAEKQSSRDEKVDPVKRLVDAVTSMLPRASNSAIQDISDVISLTDRIAENYLHDDSTKIVFQDLADDIRTFRMQSSTKDQMEIETRFCERASAKRLKIEPSDVLFQEIKEINDRFLEVKVDVMSMDYVSSIRFEEGNLIRCSYVPVGPASIHMIHKLLLELIVPADYPAFSPTISENMSRDCGDSEEGKYLWTKAKSNFDTKLRSFSQPITVKQMARAWETSARDVFVEYAQQMGGGSFSSRYYGMKMSGPGYSLCC